MRWEEDLPRDEGGGIWLLREGEVDVMLRAGGWWGREAMECEGDLSGSSEEKRVRSQ